MDLYMYWDYDSNPPGLLDDDIIGGHPHSSLSTTPPPGSSHPGSYAHNNRPSTINPSMLQSTDPYTGDLEQPSISPNELARLGGNTPPSDSSTVDLSVSPGNQQQLVDPRPPSRKGSIPPSSPNSSVSQTATASSEVDGDNVAHARLAPTRKPRPRKARKVAETTMADTEHHLAPAPEAPLQRPFTAEEDDLITLYFDKWGDDWEEIATALETDRQPMDVKDRWRKLREKARRKSRRASVHKVDSYGGRVHKYPVNKRFWTMEEDDKLRQLVAQHGPTNWPEIALHMDGRTDNDCHSRWSRHLDPKLNKDAFGPEEDASILELQRTLGNKWKEIATRLNSNRSGVQIHGRWLHLSKKEKKAAANANGGRSKSKSSSKKKRKRNAPTEDAEPIDTPEEELALHEDFDPSTHYGDVPLGFGDE